MQTIIDRQPRGTKEGIALNIIAHQNPDDIYQFKIDVWSEKGSGVYRLRLDGFNYLRNIEASSLQQVFLILAGLDQAQVEAEAGQMQQKIREALENAPSGFEASAISLPAFPELAVGEYFQAAKGAMLRELAPLMPTGHN